MLKIWSFFGQLRVQLLHKFRFRWHFQNHSNYRVLKGGEVSFAKICLLKMMRPETCLVPPLELHLRWIWPIVFSQISSPCYLWRKNISNIFTGLLDISFYFCTWPGFNTSIFSEVNGHNRASNVTIEFVCVKGDGVLPLAHLRCPMMGLLEAEVKGGDGGQGPRSNELGYADCL